MTADNAAAHAGADSTYPESKVLIIITGGTICMQPSAAGLVPVEGFVENAMAPRITFNDQTERVPMSAVRNGEKITIPSLRTPPSSYSKHVRYGAIEFNPLLDSSSISSDGWAQIAAAVHENYHLFDGFVVLHGTDSLSYSASALSFMMEDLGKPVILTGSQASIFALQSDAVDNLLGSLIIAGTFAIPEVCLFFHHTLFRGNRTTKVSASAFEAFASPNLPPLARVTGLGVDVNWGLVRRPTRLRRFRIGQSSSPSFTGNNGNGSNNCLDTAHVACIRIFPGIRPEMIDALLRSTPDLKGLILETFGMGNAPSGVDGSLTRAIGAAVSRGVVVVNVSQCTSGFVSPVYAPAFALGRAGVVPGYDLTSEAALTKLAYLLACRDEKNGGQLFTPSQVAESMALDLKGELTELSRPSFAHPAGYESDSLLDATSLNRLLSAADAAFTVLGHAIARGDTQRVKELLDESERQQERTQHHLPAHAEQLTATTNTSNPNKRIRRESTVSDTGSVSSVSKPSAMLQQAPMLLSRADYAGNTAVHLAAVGPERSVMEELLTRGASVHVRNLADHTPLYLAQKAGREEVAALLREAGAVLWEDE